MRTLGALFVLVLLQGALIHAADDTATPEPAPAPAGEPTSPVNGAANATEGGTCKDHSDCRSCILDTSCGWCSITGECTDGTVSGPNNANCSVWDYAFCTGEPCSSYKTCHDCLKDSFCGWCDSAKIDDPNTDSKCTEGNWQGAIFGSCGKDMWHKASCPPKNDPNPKETNTTLGHGDPTVKNGPMPAEPAASGAAEASAAGPAEGEAAAISGAGAVAAAIRKANTVHYKVASASSATLDEKAAGGYKVASKYSYASTPDVKDEVPPSAPVASMDDAPVPAAMPKPAHQGPPTIAEMDEMVADAVPIPRNAAGTMIEMEEQQKQESQEDKLLADDSAQFSA